MKRIKLFIKGLFDFDNELFPVAVNSMVNLYYGLPGVLHRRLHRRHRRRTKHSDSIEQIKRIRTQHNKSVRKEKQCGGRGLACYTVDNESFQTEPRWTNGDACYCSNASNGTFFCIRGLNETGMFSTLNLVSTLY